MARSYARHDHRRRPAEERRRAQVTARLARIAAVEAGASPLAANR